MVNIQQSLVIFGRVNVNTSVIMKSTICIFLLTILSNGLFAQEDEKLADLCKNFSYQEIVVGLNEFQNKTTDEIGYSWRNELQRELVNGFFEQIIEFTKTVQDEENSAISSIYTHKIKLIKKKVGKVAYYKVVELVNVRLNGEWVPPEVLLVEDSNSTLVQLETDFKKVYSKQLSFKELFVTDIVFGSNCGFGGGQPDYKVKMNQLVKSKDTATIIEWLKSATAEIQLYAIDGILTLENSGVHFGQPVLDLIEIVSCKEGTAYTCSGCIHWHQPIDQTIERIKKQFNKR